MSDDDPLDDAGGPSARAAPRTLPWLVPLAQEMLARRARWPHALLVTGPQGIGKRDLADGFARALLCETPRADGFACGACASCGYVAAGQQYKAKAAANQYWTDTAGGMFNAVIGQSTNQYYDASGKLIVDSNPAVKAAWDESMKVAAGGLSAKLSQFSTAWNVAFTTGTFATIACPSWMVGYIKSEAGAMSGQWNIADIPGGGGDWGGSYLSIPKASKHQKEAYDLISWLTAAEQEAAVFKAVGNFPSNSKAATDPTVSSATDKYFSGGSADPDNPTPAPIGKIFGDSASKLQPQILGPHDGDVKNAISTAITRVETGSQSPDKAWNQLITKDIPAAVGA